DVYKRQDLYRTYHNVSEEWYLVFKDGWAGNITAAKETASNMRYTTFGLYQENKKTIPLLKIYVFTGDDRESLAKASGFIYLGSSSSSSYAAVIPPEAAGQKLALNEKELKQNFRIIPEEWATDEY
ncbi:MAG: hypothetical protein N2Z65_02765, partial [Clostridiales bacterium]|nr:hypothetical protein [Clostridiales bacterium]